MSATRTQRTNLEVAQLFERTYVARRGRGRIDAMLERFDDLFTEDFAWRSAIVGGVEGSEWRGREGFASYGRELFDSFEDVEVEGFEHEAVGDDTILTLCRVRIVGRDSQVALDGEFAFVWRFRDGRIAAGRSYLSHAEAREAAGAA